MPLRNRVAAPGIAVLATACILTSCSNGQTAPQKKAVHDIRPTTTTTTATTTTTSTSSATTTTQLGVPVPNVIGLKIGPARAALRAAGFTSLSLNTPCNKGTVASQSVVDSLAIPGKGLDVRAGATALRPGASTPTGTQIGISWSGCFGGASEVPALVGLLFPAARRAIHAVGLTWACFSVSPAAATTATHPAKTTSTKAPGTTTTVTVAPTVLTQSPSANSVLQPGATVTFTMRRCPQ